MSIKFFTKSSAYALLVMVFAFFSCQKELFPTTSLTATNQHQATGNEVDGATGYYSNLLMDKLTFDSIQLELSSSAEAQSLLAREVTAKANDALMAVPQPVTRYSDTDGDKKVGSDAAKIYALGLQYFLFQEDAAAAQYLEKAKEFLLSWAAKNLPTNHTPNESGYLPFLTGYSLIRSRIDADSRTTIDNWFRTRFNFYKGLPVRTNNWETIRNLFMLNIAYTIHDVSFINQASADFNKHHNTNYRADGASVDFLGRDGFAYHVYDLLFVAQIGRTLAVYKGKSALDSLVHQRSTRWVNLRINPNDPPVLGGSISDAISFMAPYVLDPVNHVHLEFVHTEWAPDKNRSDYNKPYNATGSTYAFVEMASLMRDEMFSFLRKLNPNFTRYSNLPYYINSFGKSRSNPYIESVTFYGDLPFRGWYKSCGPGQYTLQNLTSLGIQNDQLSSIRIPTGFRVTLYEHGNFSGNSVVLTETTIDLSKYNFNDKTSSLKIEKL